MPAPKKSRQAVVFLISATILTVALFYLSVRWNTPPSLEKIFQQQEKTTASPLEKISGSPSITIADPVWGLAGALVTIVEYADFRCAHCAEANLEIKKIKETFPKEVRMVWKDFPFLPPLDSTWQAHLAARCAAKQNKFWEYHDLLFANQGSFETEQLINMAKALNLKEDAFIACLLNQETKPLVERAFNEGQALGVNATPFFFVNGEKWEGEMTMEKIRKLIK